MTLLSIAIEAVIIIVSALVAALAAYAVFRNKEAMVWGYVAAFIPRAILVLVMLTGATNLTVLAWLSHTAGIFIYPMLLTMGNILLIEVALAKQVSRQSSLPLDVKKAIKIENFLGRLQERKLLPRAVSMKEVYLSGVLAGIINLAFVLAFGLL